MHSMQFRCKMRCSSKDMLQCFFIGRRNPRLSLGSTVRADSDHLAWARVETDSCRGPLATLIAVVVTMGEPQQQCLDGEERVEARRRRAILSRNLSEKTPWAEMYLHGICFRCICGCWLHSQRRLCLSMLRAPPEAHQHSPAPAPTGALRIEGKGGPSGAPGSPLSNPIRILKS